MKKYEKPAIINVAITAIDLMQGFSGGPNAGDAENPNGPSNGGATDVEDPDHRYKGVRFYFENDPIWMEKIKK